jgi:hypothetical protein
MNGHLDACHCCKGVSAQTPAAAANRPGLSAIAYRVGTHSQFKQSMLAALWNVDRPALQNLKTRDDDDFSIALLDAAATMADVLTFYQERTANESYLRTATERRSLLELARLIGYELRPGVAASAYLAFTLHDAPGTPGRALIDTGVKVSSVPAQDQKPQTFETIEKIEARAEWNAMKPRLLERQPVKLKTDLLYFAGTATNLKAGDGLLLTSVEGDHMFRLVAEVTPEPNLDPTLNRTKVRLQPLAGGGRSETPVLDLKFRAERIGALTGKLLEKTPVMKSGELSVVTAAKDTAVSAILNNILAALASPATVLAFRIKAAIFGHNAPLWESLPSTQRIGEFVASPDDPQNPNQRKLEFHKGVFAGREGSWAETTLDKYPELPSANSIILDATYAGIVPQSRVVLKQDKTFRVYTVESATDLTHADFELAYKATRLTLDRAEGFADFSIRKTTVFAAGEELSLAGLPIEAPVSGSQIELNGFVNGLQPGQRLVVCGELENFRGNSACEPAILADVEQVLDEAFTRVTLRKALKHSYVRGTVMIYGNVALATHGETFQEVLGSGDASQAGQRFVLRQAPLTYVSSSSPSGAESTLRVRVDDVLWHEVPTLFGREPRERLFVTRTEDDGKTTVQFGDGHNGARLPSGQENVRAVLRAGIGLGGLLEAGQLSNLLTRPLGVRDVTNPMPASGAQDRESLGEARRNAPLTVLTLDRIVSLQDYEDFARSFAGIAKALATWTWNGQSRGVFLTVAAAQGGAVEEGTLLYKNLLAAIREAGHPFVPIRIASYRKAFFRLAGTLKVDPDYEPTKVLAAVRAALSALFSFEARGFGEPVTLSAVVKVIHEVPGVVAVDIDTLSRTDGVGGEGTKSPLPAEIPRLGTEHGLVLPAELLLLDIGSLENLGAAR